MCGSELVMDVPWMSMELLSIAWIAGVSPLNGM
jgi:hypothetical protein